MANSLVLLLVQKTQHVSFPTPGEKKQSKQATTTTKTTREHSTKLSTPNFCAAIERS
eukprot:m.886708 g.886708  ORF g.886708 m.886708 type:complete len:57 (-) comp59911_c0_seq1:5986-6156(-)